MREQSVHDLDRLLGIVDRDVHVHPEDQLAPRDVLQLVDEVAIAVTRRDPLPLEEGEGMGSRRADSEALIATSQRRSKSPATIPVVAGLAFANASRWARPTSSRTSALVT